MELKDVILSTLAELEDNEATRDSLNSSINIEKKENIRIVEKKIEPLVREAEESHLDGERIFLNSLKERLLVLFEGFQAPNNTNIEAKVDMTLNFLEYALATIDSRVDQIEKGKLK